MDSSLESLLERCQAGDADAFEAVVARFHGRLRRLSLGLLGNIQEAEDVVQEAFLQAWRSMPTLQSRSAFAAWLSRITVRLCQGRQRQRGALQRFLSELPWLFGRPDPGPEPVELLAWRDELVRGLQRLSSPMRSVLLMREVMELSLDEIAHALDLPVGTVKSRLHAARRQLAEHISGRPPVESRPMRSSGDAARVGDASRANDDVSRAGAAPRIEGV